MDIIQDQKQLPAEYQEIKSYDVQHVPIVRSYLERMGVVNIVGERLDTKMTTNPGHVVVGVVLDILSGRSPLYRVAGFFEHQDIELLVGKGVSRTAFCDDNI